MLPKLHQHAWMDATLADFREQVRRYISAEMVPHLDGWRRQGYIPREVWQDFGAMGFLLPEIAETWGGAGASLAYQLVVQDEMTLAEMPATTTTVHSIATHYILDYGTEAQKQRWLPKLVSGEHVGGDRHDRAGLRL
jgi:acyl-CoA dehydrogenase